MRHPRLIISLLIIIGWFVSYIAGALAWFHFLPIGPALYDLFFYNPELHEALQALEASGFEEQARNSINFFMIFITIPLAAILPVFFRKWLPVAILLFMMSFAAIAAIWYFFLWSWSRELPTLAEATFQGSEWILVVVALHVCLLPFLLGAFLAIRQARRSAQN
jgi:hypothetical protein